MVVVKNKAFNIKKFSSLIEYIDSIVVAEKLCGKKIKAEITSAGHEELGYNYKLKVRCGIDAGFVLYICENKSFKSGSVIMFQLNKQKVNSNVLKAKLETLGFNKFEVLTGKFGNHIVCIYLKNANEQLKIVFKEYGKHIFS